MKLCLLLIALFTWSLPALAQTEQLEQAASSCVDDAGNPKSGNHCICYLKKTVCSDGITTCSEQVCEQVACKSNKDCKESSGTCIQGFCKKK
jgi:uncharacterized hydantoinase/oxoprolinase family protein